MSCVAAEVAVPGGLRLGPLLVPVGWRLDGNFTRSAVVGGTVQVQLACALVGPCPAAVELVRREGHDRVRQAVRAAVKESRHLPRYRRLLAEAAEARRGQEEVEAEARALFEERQRLLDDSQEGLTGALQDLDRRGEGVEARLQAARATCSAVAARLSEAATAAGREVALAHRDAVNRVGGDARARWAEVLARPLDPAVVALVEELAGLAEVVRLSALEQLGGTSAGLLAELAAEAGPVGA